MSQNQAREHVENSLPATAAEPDLDRPRKAAVGKALLVYLGTGSIGAALVAYLLFSSMGC